MSALCIRRHNIVLQPESARVIIRPFIPGSAALVSAIIGRALALEEDEVERELQAVHAGFDSRHIDVETPLREHYAKVQPFILTQRPLSPARQLLIGALFSGEYAL